MADIDLAKFKDLYLKTARDYVTQIRSGVQNLMTKPDDQIAIEQVHIGGHSLKSQSSVMGFVGIAALSRHIELASKAMIGEKLRLTHEQLDALVHVCDVFTTRLDAIERGESEGDLSQEVAAVESAIGSAVKWT